MELNLTLGGTITQISGVELDKLRTTPFLVSKSMSVTVKEHAPSPKHKSFWIAKQPCPRELFNVLSHDL